MLYQKNVISHTIELKNKVIYFIFQLAFLTKHGFNLNLGWTGLR